MVRFLTFVQLAVLAAYASGFTPSKISSSVKKSQFSPAVFPSVGSSSSNRIMPGSPTISTSLQLKINVDEIDEDESRINPAVFKNALYVGSVVIALGLPVAFLVWSSLSD